MIEGEIDPDEGQSETFTSVSDRDNVHVIHSGHPPKTHARFSPISNKPRWPESLWSTGTLIYSIKEPNKNLPPPTDPDDKTLRFESRFESGNLSRAYKMAPDMYHLILEYDHNSAGSCMWFYFRITNVRSDIKYNFFISGFHKEDSLYQTGARVFFYSEKQARKEDIGWYRTGSQYSYNVTRRTKDKLKRATLQFKIRFPYDDDECYICNCLPYTYSELLQNLDIWRTSALPGVFHYEVITQSLCCREVPMITITSPISPIPVAGRSCIFLTGRIHPGESGGSFVLHGLIDFLISDHPFARYILDHCIVKIVPMIAVDGVVEGSYRVSLMGHDLNRMWTNPDPTFHPVVHKTKEIIKAVAQEHPVVLYLDFHGHSSLHGTFAYGCPNDESELKDAEKTFPRLFSFLSEDFSWDHCIFTFPKDRTDAGRIVVRREFGVVQSFTIETSFGGIPGGKHAGYLYDEILWKRLGFDCGQAIYHLLIPTASPLVSYVTKEISFFAPKVISKAGAQKMAISRQEDTKIGKVEVEFTEVGEEDDLIDQLETYVENLEIPDGQPTPFIKPLSPKFGFVFDPNLITVDPPKKVHCKIDSFICAVEK